MRGDLGDGWWQRLGASLTPTEHWQIQNFARNGETFASLLKLVQRDQEANSPRFVGDLALISCGTNDALAKTSTPARIAYNFYWGTRASSPDSVALAMAVARQLRQRYHRVGLLLPPSPHVSQESGRFGEELRHLRSSLLKARPLFEAQSQLELLEINSPKDQSEAPTHTDFPQGLSAIVRGYLRKKVFAEPTAIEFWHDGIHLGRQGGDAFLQLSLDFITRAIHNMGETTELNNDSHRTP